jgi:soluble lytic murein transglycosylase
MARVPEYDNLKTAPSVMSTPRFQNPQSMGEARIVGDQMQDVGKAITNVGEVEANITLDIQQEANALRVDDAMNKAREAAMLLQYDKDEGYTSLQGVDALNRPNGKPLADEYGEKLATTTASLAATLGNDAQRAAFTRQSNDLVTSFKGSAIQHEGSQFREYSKSVREGTIKNRIQNIALNYDKPDVIAEDIISIQANSKDLARQLGKAAAWGEAAAREQTSAAHMVVIETALQKENVKYADEYFKKYAGQMEPNDILRVNAVLGGELDARLAVETAGKVVQGQINNIITPDSDRAFNIAVGTESGGKQFGGAGSVAGPDEPTTSPKGAIGIAQVMPGTGPEAAKLAGLEWDEEKYKNDAAYNRAIGKAYFEKQLKDNGGSLAKAYAAYNAGPGALAEAVKKADNAPVVEGQRRKTWIEFLPAETQKYVDKNMKAFGAGSGTNEIPTLLAIQQQVREEVGGDHPKRLKIALDEAERQYNDVIKARKETEEKATAEAMREILANGGNYASLPANMRSKIPVDNVEKVMNFAKRVANGDDTTNLALYNDFSANPQKLAALTDDQFYALRTELSETDFKHFSGERAKILNGNQPEGTNPGSLNTAAINSVLDARLRLMGVDPSPDDDDKDAMAYVGGIRKFVNETIAVAQSNAGKKMNDVETEKFIDNLIAKQIPAAGWGLDAEWIIAKNRAVKKKIFDLKDVSDIPADTRKLIEAGFSKIGVKPTGAEILDKYRQIMVSRDQKSKGTF